MVLSASSPVNFGLNFRLNMPRADYESTDWNSMWNSLNNMTIDEFAYDEAFSDMGYAGGVFLRFNKGRGFVHTEAMFAINSIGFTAFEGSTREEIRYSTETTTLNTPVYLGRNLICTNVFKVRAFTGPQFVWQMHTDARVTRDGAEYSLDNSAVDFDEFTWLWSVGAGFELFMFSLDARYGFDLKGIEGINDVKERIDQKTNMLEFTLGFKFF